MSSTVTFTYRMLDADSPGSAQRGEWPFGGLRGVAKEVFRGVGGGEAFLLKEREQFYGPGDVS
jgi:hypothetical protein